MSNSTDTERDELAAALAAPVVAEPIDSQQHKTDKFCAVLQSFVLRRKDI